MAKKRLGAVRGGSTRRPRKRDSVSRAERLSMGYRILAVPRGVGPREAYAAIVASIDGAPLPRGYVVEWQWRNAPHLPVRVGDLVTVVAESSRGGFRQIMRDRLLADAKLVTAIVTGGRGGEDGSVRRSARGARTPGRRQSRASSAPSSSRRGAADTRGAGAAGGRVRRKGTRTRKGVRR